MREQLGQIFNLVQAQFNVTQFNILVLQALTSLRGDNPTADMSNKEQVSKLIETIDRRLREMHLESHYVTALRIAIENYYDEAEAVVPADNV
jgi:hypothetical protein